MRKVLLLAGLSMMAVLVFAPTVLAQEDLDCPQLSEAEEQAVFNADPSDPNGLDENDNGVPCEDDNTDDGSYTMDESPSPSPSPSPTASPSPSPSPSPTASPTPTTSQYDQYSTLPLPDTGGATPLVPLSALALILGGGLLATGIIRRR